MGLFDNGNKRVARLVLLQLGAGVGVMILTQILANLPAQDWLSSHALKVTSFVIGVVLTAIKGAEMFFSKTVAMFKDHTIPDDLDDNPLVPPTPTPVKSP